MSFSRPSSEFTSLLGIAYLVGLMRFITAAAPFNLKLFCQSFYDVLSLASCNIKNFETGLLSFFTVKLCKLISGSR